MVHLSPPSVRVPAKDASGANGQWHQSSIHIEFTTFTPNDAEYIAGFVKVVVVELESIGTRAREELLVDRSDFPPASLDPSQRIIHDRLGRVRPILLH